MYSIGSRDYIKLWHSTCTPIIIIVMNIIIGDFGPNRQVKTLAKISRYVACMHLFKHMTLTQLTWIQLDKKYI